MFYGEDGGQDEYFCIFKNQEKKHLSNPLPPLPQKLFSSYYSQLILNSHELQHPANNTEMEATSYALNYLQ